MRATVWRGEFVEVWMSGGDGYVDFEWGVPLDFSQKPSCRGYTRWAVWPFRPGPKTALRRATRKAEKLDREYVCREAFGDSFCAWVRRERRRWAVE